MRAVRGLGELLVTAGLVVLLFLVYQLYWTNYEADRAAGKVSGDLRHAWSQQRGTGASGGGSRPGAANVPAYKNGVGFAFLHIPRLGKKWVKPIVQGVTLPDLTRGVGHYPGTAAPGAVGNFAVAGHRATNGEPFAYLDEVRVGDVVVAETRTQWFTYVIDRTKIVTPESVWVLDPVPGKPSAKPTEPLITLTTCNPRWASYERLIVFGHLTGTRPRAQGPPPVLTAKAGA